jgi:dTDP-4-amino-4,6-dideoxygalactose transaminase
MVHYPIPPHKQNAYREWAQINLPITEKIHNQVLSLPISPVMDEEDAKKAVQVLNAYSAQ